MGTPLVTWPAHLMRSRTTAALYQKMQISDLVVGDAKQYVNLAVRLGTDATFQTEMRK